MRVDGRRRLGTEMREMTPERGEMVRRWRWQRNGGGREMEVAGRWR